MVEKVWSKKNRITRPAIFLDRDGTLIRHRLVASKKEHMRPFGSVAKGLQLLQAAGHLLIVITNQPNIEKGLSTIAETKKRNEEMAEFLQKKKVTLDAVYFCPQTYTTGCDCRKPELGLLKAAQKDFSIDMKKSWMIGDTTTDMELGSRARIKTILVKTGNGGKDKRFYKTKGTYVAKDVQAAAKIISATM